MCKANRSVKWFALVVPVQPVVFPFAKGDWYKTPGGTFKKITFPSLNLSVERKYGSALLEMAQRDQLEHEGSTIVEVTGSGGFNCADIPLGDLLVGNTTPVKAS